MKARDLLRFSFGGLSGHGLRTALSLLGVAIGVAAVIALTALGEGARLYVIDQFSGLGSNLLIVMPGKTETTGLAGFGGVPNDLTLEDAEAVRRQVRQANNVAPVAMGTEEVAFGERRRQVGILGTTHDYQEVRQVELARGHFLPAADLRRGSPVAVLGSKLARELFVGQDPVGQVIRVGGWRMRVIGVLAPQGVNLGVDFDDIALVPVRTAMQMLNRRSLFRLLVQVRATDDTDSAKASILALITDRHDEEDVTVVTQDALVSTFSGILDALTLAVAAIAAISLSVAGIGIMNVMLVSVSERTREIGLLRALGVARSQILGVFLIEACLVSALGGLLGLAVGLGLVEVLVRLFPSFPAAPPGWAIGAALALSVAVGAVFGLLPARRATRLDPVVSLSRR